MASQKLPLTVSPGHYLSFFALLCLLFVGSVLREVPTCNLLVVAAKSLAHIMPKPKEKRVSLSKK